MGQLHGEPEQGPLMQLDEILQVGHILLSSSLHQANVCQPKSVGNIWAGAQKINVEFLVNSRHSRRCKRYCPASGCQEQSVL